jgi:hypothetical protein
MRLGGLVFIAALVISLALVFDAGGVRSRVFGERPEQQREFAPPRLPAPATTTPSAAVTPAWYLGASGYEGAELERQSARANLIIYFQKRACDPCRKFEREVLASPEVKSFLADVVKVRVDPDDGAAERKLAARFGVSDVPAIAVVPDRGPPRRLPDQALANPHLLVAYSR